MIYQSPKASKTATISEEDVSALMNARAGFPVLTYLLGNLLLWDSDRPAPGLVVLRRSELMEYCDTAAGREDFDAVAAAQQIIDEVLAKENS